MPAHDEMALRSRIQGTAFDHSIVDSYPGLLSAECIINDMQLMLPEDVLANAPWEVLRSSASRVTPDINVLLAYWFDGEILC